MAINVNKNSSDEEVRSEISRVVDNSLRLQKGMDPKKKIDGSKTLAEYKFDALDAVEFIMGVEEEIETVVNECELDSLSSPESTKTISDWYEFASIDKIKDLISDLYITRILSRQPSKKASL